MKRILALLVLLVLFSFNVYSQPVVMIADGDRDQLEINSDGSVDINQNGFNITPITYNDTGVYVTETDTVVWTPASGNSIVLMGVSYFSDTKGTFLVESGSTVVIPTTGIDTQSGTVVIVSAYPIWKGSADETLTYTTDTTSSVHSILMWGFEE